MTSQHDDSDLGNQIIIGATLLCLTCAVWFAFGLILGAAIW